MAGHTDTHTDTHTHTYRHTGWKQYLATSSGGEVIIRQPWTSGLLQSINKRHKLFRKSIGKPRNSTTYQSYIKYRNVLNSLKRTTKQNYYGNLLTEYKYDIRKTWKILNTIIGRTHNKTSISDNCIINDSSSTDQNKIADGFGNYFTNVGKKLAANIKKINTNPLEYLNKNQAITNSIYLNPTSPEEI